LLQVQGHDEHLAAVPQADQERERAAVTQSLLVEQGRADQGLGVPGLRLPEQGGGRGGDGDGRDDQRRGPAAPAPCMTRAVISRVGSLARPPARLASENAMRPATNMRRLPSMSAARPPRMSSPPNEMAYPVTTHCTASGGMRSSRSMEGRATFTMLKSRTTMNAATRIRASAKGWRVRPAGVVGAGAAVIADAVSEDAGPGMIPIRYVTDRFGFWKG
jgi:hypothetical protein